MLNLAFLKDIFGSSIFFERHPADSWMTWNEHSGTSELLAAQLPSDTPVDNRHLIFGNAVDAAHVGIVVKHVLMRRDKPTSRK